MTTRHSSIHLGRYLALLQALYPPVSALAAFDRDANPVWRPDGARFDAEPLAGLVAAFAGAKDDAQLHELDDGQFAELVRLGDGGESPQLIVCLLGARSGEEPAAPLAGQPAFDRVSALLYADYRHGLELAARDDELLRLREQLTRRQQELDLMYRSEDQDDNSCHGRELLHQLVFNTARYLNIDVVYLYIAGQNIAMHRYHDDNAVPDAGMLFDCLRHTVHPLLLANPCTLVVNDAKTRRKHGIAQDLPFGFVASPLVNGDGETIGLLASASREHPRGGFSSSELSLLEVMAKKASKIAQSHFDPLTGLENGHSFELILRDLLRESRDRGVNHAIANIDIDRLAVVNDISGRAAGNHLIRMVANKLVDMVRTHDLVARLGSDKFGILLKNCDLKTAEVIMKKVSHAVSSLDVEWRGKRHEPSISIGVAPITSQAISVMGLLEAAETARNVSKQRGRNNIHVLDMEDSNLLRRKEQIRWVGRIQEGLRDNRFRLYAQLIEPIGAHHGPRHYEILLRLQDEDGRIIDPGEFLAAAESFYLMANLDLWVINQAFHELTQVHRESGEDRIQLSINLSGQSLNDPFTLASYIENKLEEYELDGADICFEITESAAIANLDEASRFIESVRGLGCRFSLDDFGTGLSSFSYLKNLNVDYLKIDGSFVRDILRDPVSESMVAAINQVGQAMNLETVAEYVEDDDIKRKLASMGVDYGQGYGIGRPALFSDIQARLARSA